MKSLINAFFLIFITYSFAQIPDIFLHPISLSNNIYQPDAILEIKLRPGFNDITQPFIIAEGLINEHY